MGGLEDLVQGISADLRAEITALCSIEPEFSIFIIGLANGRGIAEMCEQADHGKNYWSRLDQDIRDRIKRASQMLAGERVLLARYNLQDAAPEASQVMISLLHDRNPRVRYDAAQTILKMVGAGKPDEQKMDVNLTGGMMIHWDMDDA